MTVLRGWKSFALFLALASVAHRAAPSALAQEPESITGHVSAGGRPVQGATVRIRELGIGTTTNADGRFTFIVRSSSVRGQTVALEARQVRYNPASIPIVLTGGTLTQDFELFPVGDSRGTVDPQSAGQNATAPGPRAAVIAPRPTLDSTAFEQLPGPTDVVSALAGRVVGLDVTSGSAVGGSSVAILRGYRSVLGNTQPLFVVDGVPIENTSFVAPGQPFGTGGFDYGNPIQSIEPGEIASVQVLRGPAAAIWGGRGANGVILITTRGGSGFSGFEVSASQTASSETALRLPSFQNAYGQGLNGQYSFFDGAGGGTNDGVAQNWGPALSGQAIAQASLTVPRLGDVRLWLPRPNNVADFFGSGLTLTTIAAAQQAGANENYRLSIDRRSSSGFVPGSSLTRQGASLRAGAEPTSSLSVDAHVQVNSDVAEDRPATGYDLSNSIADFAQTGRQVDFSALKAHTTTDDPFLNEINWIYSGINNPYFAQQENSNRDDRTRWIAAGSASYVLTPDLTALARLGTDHHDQSRNFDIASSWMGGFPFEDGRGDFSKGGFQRQDITASETNADLLLSADLGGHPATGASTSSFKLTGGYSHRSSNFNVSTAGSDQHPDTGTATAGTPAILNSNTSTNSVLATGEWAVNSYTSLTATARNEWYSLLASGSNSAFYPSVVGRIDLARAAGVHGDNLNSAIVHAGWSRTGNEVSPLLLNNVFIPAADSAATVAASAGLSPEITTSLEIGGALSFMRNRLGVDVTLYDDQTTGVILGAVAGSTSILASNLGTLSNKGIELQASLVPLRTSSGTLWTVDARWAKNTNSLDDLSNGATAIPLGPSVYGLTVEARKGYALGALVGSGFKRDASGAMILQNGLPVSDGQQRVLGVMAPSWTGGVSSNLHVGWFDVSGLVDARMGGSIFSTTNLVGMTTGTFAETASRPDSGQAFAGVDAATGKANTVRATTQAYYQALAPIQEAWVYDASFVKLRDLRVSFSWPLRAVTPLSGQSVRVSLIGRNLAMWSKAPNIDPETALSSTSFQGVELGQLPTVRSFGLQISLTP